MPAAAAPASGADSGYRGIWFTLGQFSEGGDKYSGGLGTYTPIFTSNSTIFAHVRAYEDDVALCVHNLARSAQAVELDLRAWEGRVPVEMFGSTPFPRIGELPYLLTLAPRGFFWFLLSEAAAAVEPGAPRRGRDGAR